jgi:glutamine amidotransferase
MCRLFALHAGTNVVTATFWLLDAADSLAAQSRRNPDGTGLGAFDAHGQPQLKKQPMAAWRDADFAAEAHEMTGTTFVAHVRYATSGADSVANTHPFAQDGRILAHNGAVEGLDVLDAELHRRGVADLVAGQTDSERMFALITDSIRTHDGDVAGGLVDALGWLAANVPIFSANMLASTATDVWALRYPEPNELYMLDRRDGALPAGLNLRTQRIHADAEALRGRPSVVLASEPMDDDPAWQLIAPGELVHVDAGLAITREVVLPDPPAYQLGRDDLKAPAAAAQHPAV